MTVVECPPTSKTNCRQCNKLIRSDIRIIKCDTCDYYFHVKCCAINHKTFNAIKCTGGDWICKKCVHTNDNEVRNTNGVITNPELTFKRNVNVASVRKIFLPTSVI